MPFVYDKLTGYANLRQVLLPFNKHFLTGVLFLKKLLIERTRALSYTYDSRLLFGKQTVPIMS